MQIDTIPFSMEYTMLHPETLIQDMIKVWRVLEIKVNIYVFILYICMYIYLKINIDCENIYIQTCHCPNLLPAKLPGILYSL